MMRAFRILALPLLLGLAAGQALALSDNAGTSGAPFLKLGGGARAAGMAHAYTAAADDIHAVYYNPGALTRMTRPEVSAMHTHYIQGAKYEHAAFVVPFERQGNYSKHALGLSLYNLTVDEIEKRTQDTDLAAGTFDTSDFAYMLSYSHRKNSHLGLGASFKMVRQRLDVVKESAFALDLGAQYRLESMGMPFPIDFGLSLRNLGTKLSYAEGSDPLPFAFVFGTAVRPWRGFTFDLDLIKYRDTSILLAFGSEYQRELLKEVDGALRFGFSTARSDLDGLSSITIGSGLSFRNWGFDFSWVPFGDLGDTFRYSLQVKF